MKKQKLKITFVCFFTCSIFFLIGSCQEDNESVDEQNVTGEIAAPAKLIANSEAKFLYDNFESNRASIIKNYEKTVNKKEDFTPTKFVDWDLATIEQYLAYIKQEAGKANVEISTIRFYLGQYGLTGDAKTNGHTTLFMLPTMEVDGQNHGFYIESNGSAALLKDKKNTTSSKGSGSLTMNRSTAGPPPVEDY